MQNSFSNEERLKSRKIIDKIFANGHVVKAYPIRIQFAFHENTNFNVCQIGVSVPKRNFKKAVDRNRVKRQIREAFRLTKHDFYNQLESNNKHISMMIIYVAREKMTYVKIDQALKKALSQIKL